MSPLQVAGVKRELNVAGTRFESLWPDSFLDGLWACLDTDHAQRTAGGFQIRGIPTVIVFLGGAEVARQTGAVALPALEALLKRALPGAA